MPLSRHAVGLALLSALLILSFQARGESWAWGLGSRSLARGGACVAWPDEGPVGSCNPAGPVMLSGMHLLFGLMPQLSSSGLEEKLLGGSAGWGTIALAGSLALGVEGGEMRESWSGSLALRTGERLALGVGVERHRLGREGAEGEWLGLDFGVLLRVGPAFLLGLNFGQALRGEGAATAPLTRVGARLDLGWLSGSGELALSPTAPLQLSWGAEVRLFKPLVIRLGSAAGAWTAGLGVDSGRLKADFALFAGEAGPVWMVSTEIVLSGMAVVE